MSEKTIIKNILDTEEFNIEVYKTQIGGWRALILLEEDDNDEIDGNGPTLSYALMELAKKIQAVERPSRPATRREKRQRLNQ